MPPTRTAPKWAGDPMVPLDPDALADAVTRHGEPIASLARRAEVSKQLLTHWLKARSRRCRASARAGVARALGVEEALLSGEVPQLVRYFVAPGHAYSRTKARRAVVQQLLAACWQAAQRDGFAPERIEDVLGAVFQLLRPTVWQERVFVAEGAARRGRGRRAAGPDADASEALVAAVGFVLAPWLEGTRQLDVPALLACAGTTPTVPEPGRDAPFRATPTRPGRLPKHRAALVALKRDLAASPPLGTAPLRPKAPSRALPPTRVQT